jgi:drug/metabolite transporter (DMT)-like permease
MLLATLFFSLMSLEIKFLPRIPVLEIVFFRAAITLALCLVILKQKRLSPWGTNRRLLLMRGCFGTLAMIGYFTALTNLPISTASTLQKLSPVFTVLIAAFLFAEKVGYQRWTGYFLAFSGVIMVKGLDPGTEWRYVLLGVCAAFSAACAYTCIARLKETEDPQVIMFYFPLVTLPLVSVPCLYGWVTPTPDELALLVSIGVTVQTAQFFMTRSYQSGATSQVSIITYLGIPLALLFDGAILGHLPTPGSIAGMGVVVCGVLLTLQWSHRGS